MKAYQSYKESGYDWTGDIPEQWNMAQLKFVAPRKTDQTENVKEFGFQIALENIESKTGRLIDNGTFEGLGNIFRKGDVLFNKLRPYLCKVVIAPDDGVAVSELLVLRPREDTDKRYLFYRLLESKFISVVDGSTYGAKMPRANWDFIGNLKIPVPSLPEQQAIADFLDRKTTQIDALIEKKQRQIDLLQEQRTALINHAVTKGLNPNVRMKDSGVEWLGEIPSHWKVAKLSYLTERIGDGLHGTPEYVDTSDYYFINGNNLVKGEIQFFESTKCVSKDEFKKYDIGLNNKTILLSINGTIGNVAFYRGEKVMLGKSAAYIVFQDDLLKNYFFHYLQSTPIQNYFGLESTGTTIYNLSLKTIRSTPLPLPPDDEKKAIVDYLNKQQLEFDKATDIIIRQIDTLKEYRTALISEAVTGKVDVRTAETVHE